MAPGSWHEASLRSPNLNPSENCWSQMKIFNDANGRRAQKDRPEGLEQHPIINNLSTNTAKNHQAVVDAKGGHVKYQESL